MSAEPLELRSPRAACCRFAAAPFGARRKRRPLWLLLGAPLAGALSLVGAPAVLVVWVLHSSRPSRSARSTIEGSPRVPRGWVEQALAPLRRRAICCGCAWTTCARACCAIRGWRPPTLDKELPRRLRVRVRERRAAALWRSGASLAYLDAQGHAIGPWSPLGEERSADRRGAGIGRTRRAGRGARGRRRARAHGAGLGRDAVGSRGAGGGRLPSHLGAVPFPLVVRAGTLELGARRLQALLPEISRRYSRVEGVDLRSERRIVIEPAAVPAGAGAPAQPRDGAPAPDAARAAA